MNYLQRLMDLFPSPYTQERDSVLAQYLDVLALELEVIQEDIDRMRQTHWVNFVYRLQDLEKLAALMEIRRLPWENLRTFRDRLLPLIVAHLKGALGPNEIREFVFTYFQRVQRDLQALFVPGLETLTVTTAFCPDPERPHLRYFAFVENPEKRRRSNSLRAISGRVPYLYRWMEENKGMDETAAEFAITGYSEGKTAVPVIVNWTTGDYLGYKDTLKLGQTLLIERDESSDSPRTAKASIAGENVSDRLFSLSDWRTSVPFAPGDLDATPLLPRMVRGSNEWTYLAIGHYDIKGLNRFFFALADKHLTDGKFNKALFDRAVFPTGAIAKLEMSWIETEPASFEVHVPRYLISEPRLSATNNRPYEQVAEVLETTIRKIRAAGVKARVRFTPFTETQNQMERFQPSWIVLDPEIGPTGNDREITLGARFGEARLGKSRFE